MSINKVILIGHVGKDPETRQLNQESSVTNFSLATSENYTNKNGEKVENTEWHNVVMWNKPKLAEYIKKGTQLYIEGKIKTRSYETENGKRYVTEIYAETLQLLGRKEIEQPVNTPPEPSNLNNQESEDLPF